MPKIFSNAYRNIGHVSVAWSGCSSSTPTLSVDNPTMNKIRTVRNVFEEAMRNGICEWMWSILSLGT
jgi:hypothetical protein